MKKPNCAFLNFIVSILAIAALVGYFLLPLWKISAKITFTEELSRLILTDSDAEKSEEAEGSEKEDILDVLIKELIEEKITLEFTVSIDTMKFAETAFSASKRQTKIFLYSLIDDAVKTLNKESLKKLESSIAKSSVSAAIKVELKELAKNQDKQIENVMEELGIDDAYLGDRTTSILNAIETEGATVDTVTTIIVDVVKDVYDKYGNSSLADETFENLTLEDEQELKEELTEIISQFANEDGTFNSDGLISSLIGQLLAAKDSIGSEEKPEEEVESESTEEVESESTEEVEACVTTTQNLSFAVRKYLTPAESEEETKVKTIEEKLADAIKASITDKTLETARTVIIAVGISIAFCAIWWLYVVLKILLKIGRKNPLVKLKSPIIFGGIPFIVFVLLPTLAIKIIQISPSFIHDLINKETLSLLTALFNESIELTFASSSLIAFACGFVLFIFGFHYSKKRKSLKRAIKQRKRAAKRSGGLY